MVDEHGRRREETTRDTSTGNKKRYQYCTDSSRKFVYLRALQGHPGRNLIDPTFQNNIVIPVGSSSTFITSDVQSIYIPSSIQDLTVG